MDTIFYIILFVLNKHKSLRPVGQAVKTPPFHGGNTGSNPVRVILVSGIIAFAGLAQLVEHRTRNAGVTGSSPAAGIIRKKQVYKGF